MNTLRTMSLKYKSYTGKTFSNGLTGNGADPTDLTVKVFATKKPKAEVSVSVGWFSESRGIGGGTATAVTFTDAETVAMCRAALASDAAVAPLVDKVLDTDENDTNYYGKRVKSMLARWFALANSPDPNEMVNKERRERALESKSFKVGDKVLYTGRHGLYPPVAGTVVEETFKWSPHFGGGWLYRTDTGCTGDNLSFRPAPAVEPTAAVV